MTTSDLVYRPGHTYQCAYCGEPFVGNDKRKDVYRCDEHAGGYGNPALIRRRVLIGDRIPPTIRQRFPLIRSIVHLGDYPGLAPADSALGPWACAPGNLWGVSMAREGAHAHREIYRICTMLSALWREDYTPTTELLHEYAHLVSQSDHLDRPFWETNKRLHREHGVSYEGQERIQREFGWFPR